MARCLRADLRTSTHTVKLSQPTLQIQLSLYGHGCGRRCYHRPLSFTTHLIFETWHGYSRSAPHTSRVHSGYQYLLMLWRHEAQRVLCDKLTNNHDKGLFQDKLNEVTQALLDLRHTSHPQRYERKGPCWWWKFALRRRVMPKLITKGSSCLVQGYYWRPCQLQGERNFLRGLPA